MSDRPLVSIGMPVWNGESYIAQALNSLLRQDHDHIELIISDNASTDRTADICREIAAADDRVRYHRNPQNVGAIANFNVVLEAARGDYFMWAAADDTWEPAYISTLLAQLESDPRAVLAFSAFNNVNEEGNETRTYPSIFDLSADRVFDRLLAFMLQEESLGKANLIYGLTRRSALRAAGEFKVWSKDEWGGDMLVVFRLLSMGNVRFADRLLFHKRLVSVRSTQEENESGAGLTTVISRFRGVRAHLRRLEGYFSGYRAIIGMADGLTIEEKRHLRAALLRRAYGRYWTEVETELIGPTLRSVRRRAARLC